MKQNYTLIALTIVSAIVALVTVCSCSRKEPKILILYYSQTGVTDQVAQEIQKQSGADIERFDVVEKYDGTFEETIQRCLKERETGFVPTLVPIKADLNKYDVVFLGTPVWFGTYAPAVAALLANSDLSGKKIVPVCTFGSGGLESTSADLQKTLPASEIFPGFGIRAARLQAAESELDYFLKANGYKDGEVAPMPEYSEQQPVTPEEAAIYAEAVEGYPFPMGEPVSVCRRAADGGADYIFTTLSKDREGNDVNCQVYVIAREGAKAEFTRVNR